MRVRITLEIQNDDYRTIEAIAPVECLFAGKITPETLADIQQLTAEAIESHTRKHKTFDGLAHWDGKKYSISEVSGG